MQRLQTLMQSLLLRRTKEEISDDGQPLVSDLVHHMTFPTWCYHNYQIKLPSKQVINHSVMLNEDEQCVFNLLFVQCRYEMCLNYWRFNS